MNVRKHHIIEGLPQEGRTSMDYYSAILNILKNLGTEKKMAILAFSLRVRQDERNQELSELLPVTEH